MPCSARSRHIKEEIEDRGRVKQYVAFSNKTIIGMRLYSKRVEFYITVGKARFQHRIRRKFREPRNAIETKRNWMSCFISVLSQAEEIATLHRASLNSRHFPGILGWIRATFLAYGVYSNLCLMHVERTHVWDWYEFRQGSAWPCNVSWHIERSFRRQGVERKCFRNVNSRSAETLNVCVAQITDILEIQCLHIHDSYIFYRTLSFYR